MPLFLTPELEQQWLYAQDEESLMPVFNYEMPDQALEYYPVYTLRGYVNMSDGKYRYKRYQS